MKAIKFLFGTLAALIMLAGCDELGNLVPGEGNDFELSEDVLEFGPEGSSQTINVVAPLGWGVDCDASWITLTHKEDDAAGKVKVTVTVTENTGEARETEIVFSFGEIEKILKVKQRAADNSGKPDGPDDPKVDMTGWGIVGDLNGWGFAMDGSTVPDVPMAADASEKYLVALNVVFPDGRFKIRQHGEWNENYGNVGLNEFTGLLVVDHVYDVVNSWDYARDMYIAAGTYDVWLDLVNLKLYMMTAGKAITEALEGTPGEIPETPGPGTDPETGTWGIVGDVNMWGNPDENGVVMNDIVMEAVSETMYVARKVELPDGGFKFRKNNEWNDNYNLGLVMSGPVEVDHVYPLVCGGGSGNMMAVAGTYDIYLDELDYKAYIMTPGKDISEALEPGQTPDQPVPGDGWYLVGAFNSWVSGDEAYRLADEGNWYVLRNFVTPEDTVLKFNVGSWAADRGGEFVRVNAPVSVSQGGPDIVLPAGTYDIYLDKNLERAWFMAPGLVPGEGNGFGNEDYSNGDVTEW